MGKNSENSASEGFWDYSLRIYGRDAVRELCLSLQDRHDADVNILLFLCWRALIGTAVVTPEEITAMIAAVRPVGETAIAPLRDLRRRLREPLPNDIPAAREMLRQRVLEAEIAAESVAQSVLEQKFPGQEPEGDAAPAREVATAALACYLAHVGLPRDEAGDAAATLAELAIDQ